MMKRKPSYFYKILALFFCTVFATSLVLTVFAYGQLSDSLKSKVWADYQSALKKNAQTWSDLISEVGQMNQAIVLEPQTEAFFSMEAFDPVQDYNTYLRVKKLFNINPFMVSMCLYNAKADYALYCGTACIPLEDLWRQMEQENDKVILQAVRTDNGEQALVFGYPYYQDSFERPQGGVFLALDESRSAAHVFGGQGRRQMILDGKSNLLLSGERETPVILKCSDSFREGNETFTVEGRDYLCSVLRQNDMAFVSYEEEAEVMRPLVRQRNTFLMVCLTVMAFSACLQIGVVKKIYQPIASIRETFANSRFADGTAKGEFELIRQVYEEAVMQIRMLEEKNASKMRTDTLRGLLMGTITPAQAEERIREYGWDIPFSGMFLAGIQVDYDPENNLKRSMVQARTRELLIEKLSSLFYVETAPGYQEETVGMINTREGGNATFNDLVKGLEQVRDRLVEEYGITLTIGLDGIIRKPEDCRAVYARVRQLQKNRFALGDDQIIYPTRVMELLPQPLTWPDLLTREVVAAARKGDQRLFEQKAADFLDLISQYEYASAALMFARLSLEMAAQGQTSGTGGRVLTVDLQRSPSTRQEAENILQEAFTLFERQKAETQQIKESRHYKKMMEGKRYILEHYADINLGVDRVAAQMGYSSNYFARLFKAVTGFYVNDYIRQVRIMKAQEFLKNTQMTVNEIAKATGFTTSNYFYSIFKRETGMTPASFREGIDREEQL